MVLSVYTRLLNIYRPFDKRKVYIVFSKNDCINLWAQLYAKHSTPFSIIISISQQSLRSQSTSNTLVQRFFTLLVSSMLKLSLDETEDLGPLEETSGL